MTDIKLLGYAHALPVLLAVVREPGRTIREYTGDVKAAYAALVALRERGLLRYTLAEDCRTRNVHPTASGVRLAVVLTDATAILADCGEAGA